MKGRREGRQKRRRDGTLFLHSEPEKEVKRFRLYYGRLVKTEEEVVHAKKFLFSRRMYTPQQPVLMQGAEVGVIDKNWQKESTAIFCGVMFCLQVKEKLWEKTTETLSTICFGES